MYSMRHLWMAGSLAAAILTSVVTTAAAADSPNTWTEGELLAVLRADSPAADKAITCKRLAIYGTSEAVPYLSRLLPDPQLSSWSRIALEAIPGPAADEALRSATYSLEGNLLIGAINSIGVRRDASAVDLLKARLQDKNAEVASAAAVALGRIGNAAAAESLRRSLAGAPANVRSAIAEGLVLSAERSLAAGKSSEAVEIYDEVRKADVPKQRVIEATRGAILARNQDGIGLLVEQLRSKDEQLFQLALGTAREFPGGDVDKTLATELQSSAPERAALIVSAMADRPKTVVLPAVLKAAGEGPKAVRIAALGALGRVGDDSCLNSLLQSALESDADLSQAAKATLADLPGAKVDAQILAMLPNAQGKNYPLLIEVAGQRRIEGVAPVILKGLDSADPAVRGAALAALGETV
jgi:HEAT repeat protein